MKRNTQKITEPDIKKTHKDEHGDTWTEDGHYVEEEAPKGGLMDFVNRTCAGEDPQKILKENAEK